MPAAALTTVRAQAGSAAGARTGAQRPLRPATVQTSRRAVQCAFWGRKKKSEPAPTTGKLDTQAPGAAESGSLPLHATQMRSRRRQGNARAREPAAAGPARLLG